jgi:glycolate oxidase iron-sulfur subunit
VFLLERLREDPSLLNSHAAKALDDCLDCRACEAVCPSHVPTGHLVEAWRAESAKSEFSDLQPEAFRIFRTVSRPLQLFFGSPKGLRWFQRLARLSKKPMVGSWLTRIKWIPQRLEGLTLGLPDTIPRHLSRVYHVKGHSNLSQRAMLFVGCVMDTVYADTNRHTADLLSLGKVDVIIPQNQRCCGALHMHGGQPDIAREWARKNIEAFETSGASIVVVTAAGCSAMLKEYQELFGPSDPFRVRAERFQNAVVDITALLPELPLPKVDKPQEQVQISVHDPCHLAHAQGIKPEVRQMLQKAGYTICEMTDSDRCCGAAGIYSLTHPEMAQQLLERKVSTIPQQVQWVAAANPGCILQIQSGLKAQSQTPRAMHPVDLIWTAYQRHGFLSE